MSRSNYIYTVDASTYIALVNGSSTHLEYSCSKPPKVGESVQIRAYDNKFGGFSDSVMDCLVKSVDELPRKSGSIPRFLFGLNVQLIMF